MVKLLEAAKRQGKYQQVLEAVLAAQPAWANHDRPNPQLAYQAAEQGRPGLVVDALGRGCGWRIFRGPYIEANLPQDIQDLTALQVTKTPTFFVNGRSLPSFGPGQLEQLVAEGLAKSRK